MDIRSEQLNRMSIEDMKALLAEHEMICLYNRGGLIGYCTSYSETKHNQVRTWSQFSKRAAKPEGVTLVRDRNKPLLIFVSS